MCAPLSLSLSLSSPPLPLYLALSPYLCARELTGQWAQPLVMFYATELLRAVEAMHGAGILHCDIKPDNILLRDDDETDTAWIYSPASGFGAKVLILSFCSALLPSSRVLGALLGDATRRSTIF
jgi:serine/threonine protein kinase